MKIRAGVRLLGELLVTAGVVIMLFVVYELVFSGIVSDRAQARVAGSLRDGWAVPAPPADDPAYGSTLILTSLGRSFAFLHIPRLGADYDLAIVEGTGADQLAEGPGHYVGTALPGQVGNFAVAGHRVTQGGPFRDIDQLQSGDEIVVETRDTWWVYRVQRQEVVDPGAVDVIAPVPGDPGAVPDRAVLTLTTCNPKYSARQRLVVHAALVGGPVAKADYPAGPPSGALASLPGTGGG